MDEILIKACGVTYRKGQYITGVGRSTLELMKALSKINNLPFKLYYYTTGLRANNMDRTDIDFQYFKIPFPDKIIHITELDVLYRKYILRPNLVHIPHNYDDSYKEENLLLTIHDVWGYKNITNKKEKKKWERAVYNASCIVTCSQYSKSMIEETFNLPCSKVVSIPWGISSDFNKVSPAILSECKTRLNLPSRYFLSVSCSHPRKNIETLIKAFIQFNSKKREHKLVLVWSNPPKSILNLCQKNIENSDIIFLKYISDKDLVSVYNGATATFFPTVIDFADDASDINRSAYKWADIYAKVNINKSFTLFYAYNKIVDYNRIIQLPPYFGIKIWNSYQTIFYCITNYIKSLSNRSVGIHVHIKDYLLQYVHRSRLSYYETPSLKNNGNNYVFFASNLWNIENCNDTTNLIRERFIIACTKNKKIDFEGGFIIPPNHPLKEKYLKYAISKRYNIHEYLDKIKKSKIVFNTPAVHFCHGWKLGEYFCLGKIILSTNFQNNIPNGIQDRKNILFVDPKNIEEIINTITNDISFQNELQQNALSYWKNSACPQKVIEHLISYSNRKL